MAIRASPAGAATGSRLSGFSGIDQLASMISPMPVSPNCAARPGRNALSATEPVWIRPPNRTASLIVGSLVTCLAIIWATNAEAPEAFSVLGIRNYWNEDIGLVDVLAIAGNTGTGFAYEFYLGQKCYNRGPIWYYAAGGGIYSVNLDQTNAADTNLIMNGVPHRDSMHKLAIPLVIENQGEFYARLTGNAYVIAGANGFQFMSLLDGLHARGVQ